MRLLALLLVPSILLGQEERTPQRGEARPNRIERPEPNRQVPPPVMEERKVERPPVTPERPVDSPRPPMGVVRPMNPPIFMDPWMRGRPCFDRWECRRPQVHIQMRPRRPQPRNMQLTPKQQKQLLELREEFLKKRQRILNNP
jgi:hypothetical protein